MYILKYIKKNKMKQTFLLTFLSMVLFFYGCRKDSNYNRISRVEELPVN